MATKRTGLGRGIASLIPTGRLEGDEQQRAEERPVDVFFASAQTRGGEDAKRSAQLNAADRMAERARAKKRTAKTATAPGNAAQETSVDSQVGASTPATSATAEHRELHGAAAANERASEDMTAEDMTAEGMTTGAADSTEHLIAVDGATLASLDPREIAPNASQPRTEFDADDLAELTLSVREFGVMQPVVVRPLSEGDERAREGKRYELVMGERRLRATLANDLPSIPAIVKHTADDAMLRDALLENLHRSNLNPLEEASAYQQLMADFGITQEELSTRIGRSRPQIANTIRLLKLPEPVQRRVAAGVLSAGHARAVLSAGDEDAMEQLADRIVNEDLSVREAESIAQHGRKGGAASKKKRPVAGGLRGHLDEVQESLGDRLETRVRVNLGRTKGSIVIDFATIADMNRILGLMGQEGFDTSAHVSSRPKFTEE